MIYSTHQSQRSKTTLGSTPKDVEIYLTQLGFLANLTMAIVKGSAGYLFHSQALLTDGLHSLTDLVADLIALVSISWSTSHTSATRLRDHWCGKMKIESLGALILSSLLFFGGAATGSTSLRTLYTLTLISNSCQECGSDLEVPDLKAAWVAVGSILVKEWLYQTSTFICPYKRIC